MTVYVDDMRRCARVGTITANWSHLYADTDTELHAFAGAMGLKRSWHQHPGRVTSHYDVTDRMRVKAIAMGAVQVGYLSAAALEVMRRKIAVAAQRLDERRAFPAPPP
jgi:hypothetical protein